jgi:hypothetical protein
MPARGQRRRGGRERPEEDKCDEESFHRSTVAARDLAAP